GRCEHGDGAPWLQTEPPLVDAPSARTILRLKIFSVPDSKQNLPQLYRFCFLMLGDPRRAQEVFQATLREATLLWANGETPSDPFWLFRDARWRCLKASEQSLQPEAVAIEEHELSPSASAQVERLDVEHLAIWISAAPEPQR